MRKSAQLPKPLNSSRSSIKLLKGAYTEMKNDLHRVQMQKLNDRLDKLQLLSNQRILSNRVTGSSLKNLKKAIRNFHTISRPQSRIKKNSTDLKFLLSEYKTMKKTNVTGS